MFWPRQKSIEMFDLTGLNVMELVCAQQVPSTPNVSIIYNRHSNDFVLVHHSIVSVLSNFNTQLLFQLIYIFDPDLLLHKTAFLI